MNEFLCNSDGRSTLPCACERYSENNQSRYPTGVFNKNATLQVGQPSMKPVGGCNQSVFDGDIVFAWPDCAAIAEVSGFVQGDPSEVGGGAFEGDDDLSMSVCPVVPSMRVIGQNGTFHDQELREQGNFMDLDSHAPNPFAGNMHLETQRCRFFRGQALVGSTVADFYPKAGDVVSVAGDWVRDNFHAGYSEVHEARIRATAHQAQVASEGDSATNLAAVFGFFANRSRQDTRLMLDIKIPRPTTGNWTLESCAFVTPTEINPVCAGIPPQIGSLTVNPSNDTCTLILDRPANFEALFNKTIPDGLNCEDTCDGNSFQCQNVHFQQILQATWHPVSEQGFQDPGDTWICSSCSCADPSAAGATIVAPVQGCVTPGLDPANPAHRQAACAQVCQGQICGGANGECAIGACAPPAAGASAMATFQGYASCDASQPQQPVPVSPTGDYRATFDSSPGHSYVTFQVGPVSTGPIPVDGQFLFNVASQEGAAIVDFSSMTAKVHDFDVGPKHISELTLLAVQRLFGVFTTATNVEVPESDGAWAVSGRINGNRHADRIVSNQGFSGTIDLAARTFHLHIAVTNPTEPAESMVADLVGAIDNLPPVANAGPAMRTAECAVPLVLSGAGSSDPDPGDSISHYQWFRGTTALGNQSQITVPSPALGSPSVYTLRVYDQKLGASATSVTVDVRDTVGPAFTFVPPSITTTQCNGSVNLGVPSAVDACGGTVTFSNNAPAKFALGATVVTWTARDARGNTSTAVQVVTATLGDSSTCCPAGSHIIIGTSNNDTLTGTSGVDCIIGRGGQDTINGLGGNDVISGGDGDDIINAGDGNDLVFGGSGQDVIDGGTGANTLIGGDGVDRLTGGTGNDRLFGGQGGDRLTGNGGDDQLFGEADDDLLDGGPGNDLLNGGGLHDTCIGGSGTNVFQQCQTQQ